MAYDGVVTVGGPAQTCEVGPMRITKVAVGPKHNNAYVLTAGGSTLLVDAADDAVTLLGLLPDGLDEVVTTHQHPDHWQALSEVVQATGAATSAHALDSGPLPVVPSRLLEDGDAVVVGTETLTVIHLVGHTPGSVALLWAPATGGPHLFSGDCLFPGGPGNTQGDPQRFAALMDGLESKVFGALPDDTWVYPGHGADTTLGDERPHLGEWRARGW